MKQLKFSAFLILTAIIFIIFSCTKTGPAGAAGVNGSNGTTGPAGPAGTQGPQGDTGVTNVQYSQWINILWTPEGTNGADYANVNAPQINQQILDSGFVLVYFKQNQNNVSTGNAIVLLPFVIDYDTATNNDTTIIALYTIQYSLYVGNMLISNSDPAVEGSSLSPANFLPDAQVRYIIIPPGVPVPTNVSYEKVCKQFKIVN